MIRSLFSDRLVRLVLATRLITVVSAPITLGLVSIVRPADEQGYYFVFTNVQAVAALFEIGVGAMLVQFAAHTLGPLTSPDGNAWQPDMGFPGQLAAARRWFEVAAAICLTIIVPSGLVLFGDGSSSHATYLLPWLLINIALAGYLTIVPILCVLEGRGFLGDVQGMRLWQAFAVVATLWIAIPTVGSLYAIALSMLTSAAVAIGWLFVRFPRLLSWRPAGTRAIHNAHLTSAQSTTAFAWIVGFLGPQLVAPIVFRFQGPIAAGQIGLSLAAATAPLTLSIAWLQARYPEYGNLAAREAYGQLDVVSRKATVQSVLVFIIGSAAMLATVAVASKLYPALATRFLPLHALGAIAAANLAYLLFQAMAGRLRAHREESLLVPISVGTCASVFATTLGARDGAPTAAFSYSIAAIGVMLPFSYFAFRRRLSNLSQRDSES